MSTGKRYDKEPKLNYKKVFGVIIALAVFIMMIILIVNMFTIYFCIKTSIQSIQLYVIWALEDIGMTRHFFKGNLEPLGVMLRIQGDVF